MKKGSTVLIALIFALGALTNAYADYIYTPINYPGASATACSGVNATGAIGGIYADTEPNMENQGHGFILSGGNYTSVNYPNSTGTWIDGGINDAGAVVGEYQTADLCNGFLFSGGTYSSLTYPGATGCTCAIGINNAGTIVGRYKMNGVTYGFTLSGGSYSSLMYPGATYTRASGINNAGTIVGYHTDASGVSHSYVLSNGTYSPLDYPGASSTQAGHINDVGTIVGRYEDASGIYHGFSLSNGTYTTLDYPGASGTYAGGINNAGTIVGQYTDATGVAHGFLATPTSTSSLSLTKPGTGSGTVTSTPTGIDCGSTCSASFPIGTSLTLSAVPSSGSCFIGWGTPCSGYGACSFTLGSDTSLTATFQPRGTTFCDVTPGGWADDYISTLFTHHVTTGCASGSDASTRRYCPSDQVTRAQMAAFIVRAKEGEPPSTLCASGSPFTDVDQNDWSCPYITRLKDLNLTTGYGGDPTLYAPSLPITREQMAAFIIRALEGEPSATLCDSGSAFVDVPASSWSCKYVKRLKDLQLTTGYGGDPTTYAPNVLVARDQMAAFLGRAFYGMR